MAQTNFNLPVFKSEPLAGKPHSLVLFPKQEGKSHVGGQLVDLSADGTQITSRVFGFFKITDKGQVQLQLSKVATDLNGKSTYPSVGTLFLDRDGVGFKFYPRDKQQPMLNVLPTDALDPVVADAIGVKPTPQAVRTLTDSTRSSPALSNEQNKQSDAHGVAPTPPNQTDPALLAASVQPSPVRVARPQFNAG